jgi:hypothetical protein
MSTIVEQNIDFSSLDSSVVDSRTARKIQQASAIRWIWEPLKDIPLFDNLGPAVINSLTLREKVEKRRGKNDMEEVPVSDPVRVLKRCQPYPLTNCEYEVTIHERRRYSEFGMEIPENDLPATYSGADPKKEGKITHVPEDKFAYSAAKELSDKYAKEFGLVVLEPLTGIEDAEVVKQVFQMVQPKALRLVALEKDLNTDAKERIRKSTHPKAVKDLAEECRKLMLKGVAAAKAKASYDAGDFARQVQLAGAGQKGNRAFPEAYDIFMAEQLDIEVPRVVQTEKKSSTNDELLALLAERELNKGNENEALNRVLALLEEEKQARAELEEKIKPLLAKSA